MSGTSDYFSMNLIQGKKMRITSFLEVIRAQNQADKTDKYKDEGLKPDL